MKKIITEPEVVLKQKENHTNMILRYYYRLIRLLSPVWLWVKKNYKSLKITGFVTAYVMALFFLFIILLPVLQEISINFLSGNLSELPEGNNEKFLNIYKNSTEKEIAKLNRKLDRQIPAATYMIVNTSENRFYLYSHKKLIYSGICSTGSYIMLMSDNSQKWIFKTPRGIFRIRGKITSPVWIKPDWAFIEEGLPVPPKGDPSRYEYGSLGDYALSLGDGYLIHGTLYKRFLGMPVTHGCIRLNDEDLETVYRKMDIGSKVVIY